MQLRWPMNLHVCRRPVVLPSGRRLLLVRAAALDAPDQVRGREAGGARRGPRDAHLARHLVVGVVLRVRESLEVLLAEGHDVDPVLLDVLRRETEARRVLQDLRHALAVRDLGLALRGRHHGRPLVAVGVLVADDADEEAVPQRRGIAEGVLVADVAEVVDAVAVHVSAHPQQGDAEMAAELREDGDVVEGGEGERERLQTGHHDHAGHENHGRAQPAA
mmetsp:Transcript_78113/g.168875  ORF Transcript_78113/g.168875 Transcript_78113/m.168875 type:complete len:219 (-) Transcript_78113:252-908(-)